MASHTDSKFRVFDSLDAEWVVIGTAPWTRTQLANWVHEDPKLSAFATLQDVVATIRAGEFEESCNVCWALLHLAADPKNRLAGRTLLQAMIPGLGSELRRWTRQAGANRNHRDHLDQLLVGAAYEAIGKYASTEPRSS